MENGGNRIDNVCRAVRLLREATGETQQQFAARLNLAISTVVRYELSRPPRGKVLAQLMNLAVSLGRADLAETFRSALSEEMGHEVPVQNSTGECGLPPAAGELAETEYLKLILRAAKVGLPGFSEQRDAWYRIRQGIADVGVKRATIRALIEGLHQEVSRRILAGESDETILSFATADPDVVRKLIRKLRAGVSFVSIEQDLLDELMAEDPNHNLSGRNNGHYAAA